MAGAGHEARVIRLDLTALAGVSGEQHSFHYISFLGNFVTISWRIGVERSTRTRMRSAAATYGA